MDGSTIRRRIGVARINQRNERRKNAMYVSEPFKMNAVEVNRLMLRRDASSNPGKRVEFNSI